MKRRDFLKLSSAVAVAGVVGVEVQEVRPKWVEPTLNTVRIPSMIYTIDPSEMPLLAMIGTGKMTIGDWPNHSYTWVEGTDFSQVVDEVHTVTLNYKDFIS